MHLADPVLFLLLEMCEIFLCALYPEENYNVLMLHFRCNAIKFTLGTKDSRYQKASILLDLSSTETVLCEV